MYIKNFKNFINESNIKIINNLHIKCDFSILEDEFNFFHVSKKHLIDNGDFFTFHVKTPLNPMSDINGDIIEDDFTKRISLSTNIQSCLNSARISSANGCFLYATDSSKNIVKLNPSSFIDTQFTFKNWMNSLSVSEKNEITEFLKLNGRSISNLRPSYLPDKFKEMFFMVVPDAETYDEYWSLSDIKMMYIGKIINDFVLIDIESHSPFSKFLISAYQL